jgi:hypothetical protein
MAARVDSRLRNRFYLLLVTTKTSSSEVEFIKKIPRIDSKADYFIKGTPL